MQGRRLEAHAFPSPAFEPLVFFSRSRCLIDLGQTLVVLTEGTDETKPELAYQRTLYRLELQGSITRHDVAFVDESCLSKKECEQALLAEVAKYPDCQIVGVEFPKFDEPNMTKGQVIYRPSLALYGGDQGPALYIAIFMGKPRASEAASYDWEVHLKAKEDLGPETAALSIMDVSKLCGMPPKYNLPGAKDHGKDTWEFFNIVPHDSRSVLFALNPTALREKAIGTLVSMLRAYPLTYVDTTQELDFGLWMTSRERLGDEWVISREKISVASTMQPADIEPRVSNESEDSEGDSVPLVAALSHSHDSDSDGSS